jgi:hypothetical protein
MRELHTVEIKTSTAKAWGNLALIFSGMVLCWYFLWTFFEHSTYDTQLGPFVFCLLLSILMPIGCLIAYAQVQASPRTRYVLTKDGLIFPELTKGVIPWQKIERISLTHATASNVPAHFFVALEMGHEMAPMLGLSTSFWSAFQVGKPGQTSALFLPASGLEVSPSDLSHILNYYRQLAAGNQIA